MSRRLSRLMPVTIAALAVMVIVSQGDPPPAKPKPRRSPSGSELDGPPRTRAWSSTRAGIARPALQRAVPDLVDSTRTLLEILRIDPERFLELIESDRASYELAYGRLFPRNGEMSPEDRR